MERHKNALLASSRRLGKWVQSPDCNFNLVHLPLFRKKETETQRVRHIVCGWQRRHGCWHPRHQTLLRLLYLGVVSTVGAGARFNYFGVDQSHLLNSNWIEMTLKKGHVEGWREGWKLWGQGGHKSSWTQPLQVLFRVKAGGRSELSTGAWMHVAGGGDM